MSEIWDDLLHKPEQQIFLFLIVGAAVIAMALGLQYFAGFEPCELCLKERYAYYAGIPLAIGASAAMSTARPLLAAVLIGLAGVALLANAGLGLYHAGVEWHWWAGPSTCTGNGDDLAATGGDLLKSLQTQNVVRCDQPAMKILGLSLAAWNMPIGLGLGVVAARAARLLMQPAAARS